MISFVTKLAAFSSRMAYVAMLLPFVLTAFLVFKAPKAIGANENALPAEAEEEGDPAEVAIGERLFKEFRFSQFYFEQSKGNPNYELPHGDPIVETIETIAGKVVSPFKGQATACATCHLVDQAVELSGGGMRIYADFSARSPVSARKDRMLVSLRNAQAMVGSGVQNTITNAATPKQLFLHHDGEFTSFEDLSVAALAGRNMGWLPSEETQAHSHIAAVIRGDDGQGALAQEFGGSYAKIFKGTASDLDPQFVLPEEFRIDVSVASDREIVAAAAKLMTAYMESLLFRQDESGLYVGSPYDAFLAKNSLPQKPNEGESDLHFAFRLKTAIDSLANPLFVTSADGQFKWHQQEFVFGPEELEGLKIFLSEKPTQARGAGACVQCHAPPHFTDFAFHNIGISQEEYELVHGHGAFISYAIPSLQERQQMSASERTKFQGLVAVENPQNADLGLWNFFASAKHQKNQSAYREMLERVYPDLAGASDEMLLPLTVGLMKTPTLRDLGHSGPYFHNGQAPNLEEVIHHYIRGGQMARHGHMVNADPRMKLVRITMRERDALAAFLRSLNEDYE